jgi:site-specific DNA-methyltransferase (adenine-specific)
MKAQSNFEGIRLHVGDCIEGMRTHVPDTSVDVVVTSPPYNLGIKYASYEDSLTKDEYLSWTLAWAREVRRSLKDDGSLFLNIAGSLKEPLLPHQVVNLLVGTERLFHLQNTIHWVKSIAIPGPDGVEKQRGHYKPINSSRFVNDCHEYIFHLTPHGNTPLQRLDVGVPYADKSNIARWGHTGGKDLKCRGNTWYRPAEDEEACEDSNTWFVPYKTIVRRAVDRPHPATFPTDVAVRCIKLHGKNGSSVVMDPFLGIGHSALAAAQCKVAAFIGFDIERGYVEVARDELREIGASSEIVG